MTYTTTCARTNPYKELFDQGFVAKEAKSGDDTVFFLERDGKFPVLLLHGFPQNASLWHTFAPRLPADAQILIPDLPGYGMSSAPNDYSKSAISQILKAALDLKDLLIIGHDRGARVAYRYAMDNREDKVDIVLMDIVPTVSVFSAMNISNSRNAGGQLRSKPHMETVHSSHHWIFLAGPSPLIENTLSETAGPIYMAGLINNWTGQRWKGKFDQRAYASWRDQYKHPKNTSGALGDYRAGATVDLDTDIRDLEMRNKFSIRTRVLALYSVHLSKRFDIEGEWKPWGGDLSCYQVGDDQTGHFLPIEATDDCVQRVNEFMGWNSS